VLPRDESWTDACEHANRQDNERTYTKNIRQWLESNAGRRASSVVASSTPAGPVPPLTERAMQSRIMYIEDKSGGLSGPARIGRVSFSKTGRTLYYRGRSFQSLKGAGSKANYYDVETGEKFWISGPRKDGADRLYGEAVAVEIDDDVREEYWTDIRGRPSRAAETVANR
jgi:hypothetical protein